MPLFNMKSDAPSRKFHSMIFCYRHKVVKKILHKRGQKIHIGKQTALFTNGAGQVRELHVEEWNRVIISHSAQTTAPGGSRTTT